MMPRLKSRLWVEALLRGCQSEGKFGAVIKTGADDAGAVFVVINRLNATYDLFEPPPGPSHDEDGQRHFSKVFVAPVSWPDVQAHFDRRVKHDSDLWLVEIETRQGCADLKVLDQSDF